MSSFAAPPASVAERFPNITQFITGQVHHGAASKEQRLKTRDAVVEHMQKQLRERVPTYVGWVKAGSQANHLCVRGKRPDFDILFVVGDQRVSTDGLDKMFAAKRKASWTIGAPMQSPSWYLAQVEQSAQSYARLGAQNQKAIETQKPAVYMCSSDTDFDLLPALRVCLTDGKVLDGLYLIPSAIKGDDGWTLSFTGREKARFKELEAALPGVRDAIKILKYLNQTKEWGVPSIAITSVVWHASEALRIYQWPRSSDSVSWDKVRVLRNLLLAALQTGRVTHMFKTGENVLDGVNIQAAIRAVQACAI